MKFSLFFIKILCNFVLENIIMKQQLFLGLILLIFSFSACNSGENQQVDNQPTKTIPSTKPSTTSLPKDDVTVALNEEGLIGLWVLKSFDITGYKDFPTMTDEEKEKLKNKFLAPLIDKYKITFNKDKTYQLNTGLPQSNSGNFVLYPKVNQLILEETKGAGEVRKIEYEVKHLGQKNLTMRYPEDGLVFTFEKTKQ